MKARSRSEGMQSVLSRILAEIKIVVQCCLVGPHGDDY